MLFPAVVYMLVLVIVLFLNLLYALFVSVVVVWCVVFVVCA